MLLIIFRHQRVRGLVRKSTTDMACETVITVVMEAKCGSSFSSQMHHFAHENVPKLTESGGQPTEDNAKNMLEQQGILKWSLFRKMCLIF